MTIIAPSPDEPEHDAADDEPQLICPVRGTYCNDDLCPDYGCALQHGMLPDRDEGFMDDWH